MLVWVRPQLLNGKTAVKMVRMRRRSEGQGTSGKKDVGGREVANSVRGIEFD